MAPVESETELVDRCRIKRVRVRDHDVALIDRDGEMRVHQFPQRLVGNLPVSERCRTCENRPNRLCYSG